MSNSDTFNQQTQHAFLVAWGWFAERIGLIKHLQAVSLTQKAYQHRPHTKDLEFLVAILAGLPHLQDISLPAHPLDKDQAFAHAWAQPAWADYSGVSRTLRGLSWDEVRQLIQVLEQVSQPSLTAEVQMLRSQGNRLRLDGDLTGLPVSNTSRTYPHAAFGHMDDVIRLDYQAALVSLQSPTYGRLWLSVAHHPGDTVSCTQAEARCCYWTWWIIRPALSRPISGWFLAMRQSREACSSQCEALLAFFCGYLHPSLHNMRQPPPSGFDATQAEASGKGHESTSRAVHRRWVLPAAMAGVRCR
jgi:hypothetical protein